MTLLGRLAGAASEPTGRCGGGDGQTQHQVDALPQFVIENGLGYDDFMDKLIAASPNPGREMLDAADVMQISGADANPHVWYDVAKIPAVATAISDRLGKLDPADAATFNANAKTFVDSLAPIDAAIANVKTKYSGAPIGYVERVPG